MRVLLRAAYALLLALPLLPARVVAQPSADGFRTSPALAWQSGDHRVDLGASLRLRTEIWDAYADDVEAYTGLRARVHARYGWRERLIALAELQYVGVYGLDPDGSGAIATHRSSNDGRRSASSGLDVRQLYLEARPTAASWLRGGRQELKLGPEVVYAEPDWRYLKLSRVSERLLGSVGWSHEERAGDGVSGGWDLGGHHLFAFAARPTTGFVAVETAYRPLRDVRYAGGSWTVKRDTWLPHTELGVFGLAYEDERDPDEGGLPEGLAVYTAGVYWLGVYPAGPGKLDVLLWGAAQLGDYDGRDHRAGAFLAELGYQLAELPGRPWLRAGVNAASGDGDAEDGEHETFFNILPTNHLYYGFADQLAFQNLVDAFVQLQLALHAKLSLNLFVHWLWLANDADARYSGTGAFDRKTFGFSAQPSRGYGRVGTEYDLVARYTPHRALALELGVSCLDGGALFRHQPSTDVWFGYAMLELRY